MRSLRAPNAKGGREFCSTACPRATDSFLSGPAVIIVHRRPGICNYQMREKEREREDAPRSAITLSARTLFFHVRRFGPPNVFIRPSRSSGSSHRARDRRRNLLCRRRAAEFPMSLAVRRSGLIM
jgi:hypothetical protein